MSESELVAISHVVRLPVRDLVPTAENPRQIEEKAPAFQELLRSVKAVGVMIPVHVRPHPTRKGKWDLRCGHRRHRAAQRAKLAEIPAIVHEEMGDAEAFELTFTENFCRDDLTPLEQAREVEILLERMGDDARAVASKLGHTERWVRQRARLCQLAESWRKLASDQASCVGYWSVAHLELVARFDPEVQDQIAADVQESYGSDWRAWDALRWSVAALDKWLNDRYLRLLRKARWKAADATLDPQAGACVACRKRSSCQGLLFHDDTSPEAMAKDDRCLDVSCWDRKFTAYVKARATDLRAKHTDLLCLSTTYVRGEKAKALEENFGSVLNDAYVHNVRKSSPGARPALVVAGPGVGTVRWVRERSRDGRSRKDTGGPVPLSMRRDRHERRRAAWIIERVEETLTKASPPEDLLSLMAAFGSSRAEWDFWREAKPWAEFAKFRAAEDGAVWERLWDDVRKVLESRLRNAGQSTSDIIKATVEMREEAAEIADLLGLDPKTLRAEAEAALPEPKAWAKLNADGSPKAGREKKSQ